MIRTSVLCAAIGVHPVAGRGRGGLSTCADPAINEHSSSGPSLLGPEWHIPFSQPLASERAFQNQELSSTMSRPRSLSSSQIAETALAIVDRDGLGALSMRSVSAELGVTAMSLYRYVDGREQIERLIVNQVLNQVSLELEAGGSWREHVSTICSRVRRAVAAHTEILPLLLLHRQSTEGTHRIAEVLLSALTNAGFDGEHRVLAFRGLISYVIGALQTEHLAALANEGTRVMAELPASRFPILSATARVAQKIAVEREFAAGLDIYLDGLAVRIGAHP